MHAAQVLGLQTTTDARQMDAPAQLSFSARIDIWPCREHHQAGSAQPHIGPCSIHGKSPGRQAGTLGHAKAGEDARLIAALQLESPIPWLPD